MTQVSCISTILFPERKLEFQEIELIFHLLFALSRLELWFLIL